MGILKLLLAGDVMTGRGIDQVMPHPLPPVLYESWVRDAREYVRLAEAVSGPIAAPRPLEHVWGEALAAMDRLAPDVRLVNLETSITRSGTPWAGKGIHYRMSPAHVGCLTAARIDACALANNHVLDWGRPGLADTLAALHGAGIATAGAGMDLAEAQAPAVLPLSGGARVLVFAVATPTSGVPHDWAAEAQRSGVDFLPRLDERGAQDIAERVQRHRRAGDVVVVSVHWGDNWVDAVPASQRSFARRLVEWGAADVVHGHSSHHPLPAEVIAGKLVLHGCGDLINDYEGIAPHGPQHCDLGCLYAASIDTATGELRALEVLPLQRRGLRLTAPDEALRAQWGQLINAMGEAMGTRLEEGAHGAWALHWA